VSSCEAQYDMYCKLLDRGRAASAFCRDDRRALTRYLGALPSFLSSRPASSVTATAGQAEADRSTQSFGGIRRWSRVLPYMEKTKRSLKLVLEGREAVAGRWTSTVLALVLQF
jgi:hypothetical protein